MKRRASAIAVVVSGLWLGLSTLAEAHRADEYLQATLIAVDRDQIGLEISLTPGMNIAPLVFSWVDSNHDGRISGTEGDGYAQEVLNSLEVRVDGRPTLLSLAGRQFPEFREMSEGVGTIRLTASARSATTGIGPHNLFVRNAHHPEWSVYLANALVPTDDGVEITRQHRDRAQREFGLDYQVGPEVRPSASIWWSVSVFAILGGLGIAIPGVVLWSSGWLLAFGRGLE